MHLFRAWVNSPNNANYYLVDTVEEAIAVETAYLDAEDFKVEKGKGDLHAVRVHSSETKEMIYTIWIRQMSFYHQGVWEK